MPAQQEVVVRSGCLPAWPGGRAGNRSWELPKHRSPPVEGVAPAGTLACGAGATFGKTDAGATSYFTSRRPLRIEPSSPKSTQEICTFLPSPCRAVGSKQGLDETKQ